MDAAIAKKFAATPLENVNLGSVWIVRIRQQQLHPQRPVVEVALAMALEAARVTGTVNMSARAMVAAR